MRHQDLFPVPTDGITEPDELLAESVQRWADERVVSKRRKLGESFEELLSPALRVLLDEVGLRHLVWSSDGSCQTTTCTTLAVVLEQVGRADLGLAVVLASHFALQLAAGRAPVALRERLSTGSSGPWTQVGSLMLPGYGEASRAFGGLGAPALAELRGETVVIESGRPVRAQSAAADAGWFGVACELDGKPALVVVPGDAQGLRRGEDLVKKTGLRASREVEISLDRVEVPKESLVVVGAARYEALLSVYRVGCAAASVGALLGAWAILREWGETRVIKGKGQALRDNPLVAAQMGRIGARLGTSRLLLYAAARLLGTGRLEGPDGDRPSAHCAAAIAAAATVLAGAMESLDETMELMASAGYATEWQLERSWRDVKTLSTLLGPPPAILTALGANYFGCEVR